MVKTLLFLCGLGACIMTWCLIIGGIIPLGFDHGIYSHLAKVVENKESIFDLPLYLRQQYEPFSGVFFSYLEIFIHPEYIYTFGYLGLYFLIALAVCLLGKKKNTYTIGSVVGMCLMIFSIHHFCNYSWSFGKQLFATFTLILFMKYQRNFFIAFLCIIFTISLHRLTGLLLIVYIGILLFTKYIKNISFGILLFRNIRKKGWGSFRHPRTSECKLCGTSEDPRIQSKNKFNINYLVAYTYVTAIVIGILPYLHPGFFSQNIAPFLKWNVTDYFFHGKYGTGLRDMIFVMTILPIFFVFLYGSKKYIDHFSYKKYFTNPLIIFVIVILIGILFRIEGHTRLRTFLDLSIILFLTRIGYIYFSKKYLTIFLMLMCVFWGSFTIKRNHPYFTKHEHEVIKNFVQNLGVNETVFTFQRQYFVWLSKYTEKELYTLNQGIGMSLWSNEEKKGMYQNPDVLCEKLGQLPGKVVVFVGKNESIKTLQNNHCLRLGKHLGEGMKTYTYNHK